MSKASEVLSRWIQDVASHHVKNDLSQPMTEREEALAISLLQCVGADIAMAESMPATAPATSAEPLDENHEIWKLLRVFVNASDKVQMNLHDAQIWHPENFIEGGVEQLLEGWKLSLHKLMDAVAALRQPGTPAEEKR